MNICLVEDEKLLADSMSKKLQKDWYNVSVFYNVEDFLQNYKVPSDLYILDLWLPDWSWYDIINFLREIKKVNAPVIISSWYSDIDKKIHGLNIWADDYIVKPFLPEELTARINAIVRRSFTKTPNNVIKYKSFTFDTLNKELFRWKESIKLAKKELDLVEYFFYNKWKLLNKAKIISSIWWEYESVWVSDNTINVTLSRLRKKLWKDFTLVTVVWDWYMLKL